MQKSMDASMGRVDTIVAKLGSMRESSACDGAAETLACIGLPMGRWWWIRVNNVDEILNWEIRAASSWSTPFWTTRARSRCGGQADVRGRPRMEIEALFLLCTHGRMRYGQIIAFCCGGLRLWQTRD